MARWLIPMLLLAAPAAAQEEDEYTKKLLKVGAEAPDFAGTDLADKEVKLSGFKGKTVIVNFWFYG